MDSKGSVSLAADRAFTKCKLFGLHVCQWCIQCAGSIIYLMIGCIVAVYLLLGKDRFLAQAKKLIYAVFGKKQADVILHYGRMTNDTFSGFIVGKIVDSAIIGVLCFIVMWILKLPYPLLISVIVGVTNVIPVFGPYIGAVPSALLILLVNPVQCVYFVIFIIILQQLDGNVIGPAILGESTGLTAFWVLFAILLFGGLWGIAGMIVGVPLFAMIYRLLKDYLELRLYHKSLSMETGMYKDLKRIRTDVNGDKHYVLYTKQEKRNANLRRDAENKISLLQLLTQKPIEAPAAESKTMTGDSESGEEPDRKAEEQFSNGELSETDKTEKQAENSETGK
ncbi:AI-2E family transporter [Clostridium sp. OM07-10AC]|nr:AI-2E family transporter [Clostridium sp. OM07-10AC]